MTLVIHDPITDPGPLVELVGGPWVRHVFWGQPWQLGTAAYWIAVTQDAERATEYEITHELGRNLAEEVSACMLGGFGMPYELGLAAFQAVRDRLLTQEQTPTAERIEAVLREPLQVSGASRRYRFPAQKAARLAGALKFIHGVNTDAMPSADLRDWLLGAPGIGPKTSSWIVRNHRRAKDVAVLDIHIMRAGVRAGVFPAAATVQRQYRALEELFLAWANEGGVSAANLDAVIWGEEAYWARHRGAHQ